MVSTKAVSRSVYITRTPTISHDIMRAVQAGVEFIISRAPQLSLQVVNLWTEETGGVDPRFGKTIEGFRAEYVCGPPIGSNSGFGEVVVPDMFLDQTGKAALRFADERGRCPEEIGLGVSIVDYDLLSMGSCFAMAETGLGYIFSFARFFPGGKPTFFGKLLGHKYAYPGINKELLMPITRVLAAHEMGHVLGMLEGREKNVLADGGIHCAGEKGPCIMMQGEGEGGIKAIPKRLRALAKSGQELCPDCEEGLKALQGVPKYEVRKLPWEEEQNI